MWYRQRAEEQGAKAMLDMRQPTTKYAEVCAYRFAREAGHYGNLVLGPEPPVVKPRRLAPINRRCPGYRLCGCEASALVPDHCLFCGNAKASHVGEAG